MLTGCFFCWSGLSQKDQLKCLFVVSNFFYWSFSAMVTKNNGGGSHSNYASLEDEDAYSDWQLTPNFDIWVYIFFVCRHVSIWGFQNHVCLSFRTPGKEITLVLSISVLQQQLIHQWKGLHKYYSMEPQKISLQKRPKLNFDLYFDCRSAEITLASSMSVLR